MIGENGEAAPQLRLARLKRSRKFMFSLLVQIITIIRRMWVECRLVHGDLSEYNLLLHQKQLFVIDVGQTVDIRHPAAKKLLRRDITNVLRFLTKKGVPLFLGNQKRDGDIDTQNDLACFNPTHPGGKGEGEGEEAAGGG